MSDTFDLLTIALLPEVGPRLARDLVARGAAAILAHPDEHGDLLGERLRERLRSGAARRKAEEELSEARRAGIRVVGLDEVTYPQWLLRIYDPPPVLYVRGSLDAAEGSRSVAIVGSRAASAPGRATARALAHDLARSGATVVSGLARGIDTAAHQGAVEVEGRTVAVLGSGLDRVYPPENGPLAARIERSGAVVSEFALGTPPLPGHFPRRNRVIAGWGRAVVVVEAAEKSGALSTARAALEEGREVMAVPGHPSQAGAAGTNALLRDGATLVRGAADVALELGLAIPAPVREADPLDDVLAALRTDAPLSLEELQSRSGRSVPELLQRLSLLEVEARVRRLPGPLFLRELAP